jgi:transcriptional regulator with XRE-family HTH domain
MMGKTTSSHFSAWLRDQLYAHNLTVSDVATRLGLQKASIYRWTAGQRLPSTALVERISQVLEIAPETIWDVLESEEATGVSRPSLPVPPTRSVAIVPPSLPTVDRSFARWLRAELGARN